MDNVIKRQDADGLLSVAFREKIDKKLDALSAELTTKTATLQTCFDTLPCGVRIETTKGIKGQISWIWAILILVVAATVAEYFKR